MYIAVAAVAAMLCGVGFTLQQHAAEKVRSDDFLRLRLLSALIRKRRWLAGIAALAAGDLLFAWTLGHLDLSVSEPLLTTSLVFALVLAVPLSGQALRKTEIVGAVLLTAGVAALSASRSVRAPAESFGSFSHWPAAAVIALVAAVMVRAGRRRSAGMRAALTGTASGLIFGIADALTRLSVQVLDSHHPAGLLVSWPGYGALAASLTGFWLMQNAFSAAPLHKSLPAITAAEPAAGILLGVVVFGDVIHVTPLLLALEAAGLTAMVAGVILVARAPALRGVRLPQVPPGVRAHRRRLTRRSSAGTGARPRPVQTAHRPGHAALAYGKLASRWLLVAAAAKPEVTAVLRTSANIASGALSASVRKLRSAKS
jgi:drug/metabolite transporter (DMT)-like permease